MIQSTCPYCLRELSPADVTREHVVPSALGGAETVPACGECNTRIGSNLEARLLGRASWLTVISQAAGYTPGWVDVTYETGQRGREHFGDRQGMLLDPHIVVVEDTPESLRLALTMPSHFGDGYLQHVIDQQSGVVEHVERGPAPPLRATADLSVSVDDLAVLTAKVALCSGINRWGRAFLFSDLAGWLRRGIEDPRAIASASPPAGPSTDAVRSMLESVLARLSEASPSGPWTPPAPSMTVFTPLDNGNATAITFVWFGLLLCTIAGNESMLRPAKPTIIFHPKRTPESFARQED